MVSKLQSLPLLAISPNYYLLRTTETYLLADLPVDGISITDINHSDVTHLTTGVAASCKSAAQDQSYFAKTLS